MAALHLAMELSRLDFFHQSVTTRYLPIRYQGGHLRSGAKDFAPEEYRRSVAQERASAPKLKTARQLARPRSCANALSEACGRAPRCWITSAPASAPSCAARS